jgi:hypothetical protein
VPADTTSGMSLIPSSVSGDYVLFCFSRSFGRVGLGVNMTRQNHPGVSGLWSLGSLGKVDGIYFGQE